MSNLGKLQYIPFSEQLNHTPNVMVDSGGMKATVLELSHWPGNKTPNELKADTSAEIVINFLESASPDSYLKNAEVVSLSNDHYDIDGLLSVWALLEPDVTLKHRDLVIAAAETGDFDKYTNDEALKVCLTLDALEQQSIQPAIKNCDWQTDTITDFIYRTLLPHVSQIVESPDAFSHLWREKFKSIQDARRQLEENAHNIYVDKELDFVAINGEGTIPHYAIHELYPQTRVLLSDSSGSVFYYRYESFVEIVTRETLPRFKLKTLADSLQNEEGRAGTWFAEGEDLAHPSVRFYARDKSSCSTISHQSFLKLVTNYLSGGNEVSRHTNNWQENTSVLPPSKQEN